VVASEKLDTTAGIRKSRQSFQYQIPASAVLWQTHMRRDSNHRGIPWPAGSSKQVKTANENQAKTLKGHFTPDFKGPLTLLTRGHQNHLQHLW
jgi:hypothetical protein